MPDKKQPFIDIRAEIAAKRAADVKLEGAAQGLNLPAGRQVPIIPFLQSPRVICEVKRFSPSVKNINKDLDPVAQAKSYTDAGIRSISVLTEQNYFGGSLDDLIKIKTAMPDTAILRKDFLLTEEDVEISCRAGADAFLLIASLLDADTLRAMYELGQSLGMTPVVELHSPEDIEKAAAVKPDVIGINSRDLRIFKIKPLQPLKIRSMISWNCSIIYESGVKTEYDIEFVRGTGFDAALVGEAAVRDAAFAEKLAEAFSPGTGSQKAIYESGLPPSRLGRSHNRFAFWQKLYSRCRPGRPLVKICGIANHADMNEIIRLGADAAGFILAESPRRVEPGFIRSFSGYDILKIGVVVLAEGEELPAEIAALLESGALDAIQFHGSEQPEQYMQWSGYKALRIKSEDDAEAAADRPGPAVLIDAFSPEAHGGTGKRIAPELVRAVSSQQTLWLAGGINPDNVGGIIADFNPELIDISSGVEKSPGIKDHNKLAGLFAEICRAEDRYAEI